MKKVRNFLYTLLDRTFVKKTSFYISIFSENINHQVKHKNCKSKKSWTVDCITENADKVFPKKDYYIATLNL